MIIRLERFRVTLNSQSASPMPFDYEKDYQASLETREKLRAAIVLPVSLLIALGSLAAYMFQKYPAASPPFPSAIFWVALALSALALIFSAWHVAKAMHGAVYRTLAPADDIRTYVKTLREWRERNLGEPGSYESDLNEYLEQKYSNAATHNTVLNVDRSARLFRANRGLIVSTVALGIALVPFAYELRAAGEGAQRVEVLKFPFPEEKKVTDQTKPQQQPAQPPKQPDPKPSGPPLQELKEGDIPKRR